MFKDMLKTVAGAIDAGELMRTVETIWRSDREFTFPAFERTQRAILDMWEAAGLRAEMIEAPADGETIYGDLRMPIAWDCRSARMELVEPAERRCVLADRSSDPLAVVMWSGPTPPGGIEADTVRADDAKALAALGDSVRGKFVYTKNHPHQLKGAALRAGAAGIVSSHTRYPDATPDSRFWCNVWADAPDGWPQRRSDGLLPGMLLTPRQGREIERLLAEGRVRLRMTVDSNVYAGKIYMASGLLDGETDEEVLILGHAMEQGANDNATGCAVIVEAIRVLGRLVREGKLPKPRRAIRGLPVNECYGTMAFVEMRRGAVRRTVAGLNVDSVGRWAPELNAALRF
ncbi:MAG: M28 family peptidase, partial [Planctomycetota bacterium]|nr:M28 family peptidase [Planctomycetota bacterium]